MAAITSPSSDAPAGERLFSINEVAELWSISRDKVEKLMTAGELPWIYVGARRRIPESAIRRYKERHRAD